MQEYMILLRRPSRQLLPVMCVCAAHLFLQMVESLWLPLAMPTYFCVRLRSGRVGDITVDVENGGSIGIQGHCTH